MKFITIDTEKDFSEKLSLLNNFISNGKSVFILIYRNGCPPCEQTKPQWRSIEHQLKDRYVNNQNVLVADVNENFASKVNKIGSINGVPTIKILNY